MSFRMDMNLVAFENGDLESPLSSLSDEDNELESENGEVSRKIPKLPGEAGHLQSGGYNLQDELGWNDRTYESILVSLPKVLHKVYSDQTYRLMCTRWQKTN